MRCLLRSFFALIAAAPLAAATFTVNSTVDFADALPGDGVCATPAGACTLRAAIHETNALPGPDEITLPAGTYVLRRPDNPLTIRESLTINGAGAATTILDGAGLTEIFLVHPDSGNVIIRGVTIQNGRGGVRGGADLTIEDSVLRNNVRVGPGAGFNGAGRVIFRNCTISGNRAIGEVGTGGAIFYMDFEETREEFLRLENTIVIGNSAEGEGGGLALDGVGDAQIIDSTIADNSGQEGGISARSLGLLTIERSTFRGNSTHAIRGAGRARITNSTFSGNVGSAISFIGGDTSFLDLDNVTITGNRAAWGGGIFHDPDAAEVCFIGGGCAPTELYGQRLRIKNTILWGNEGGDCGGAPPVSLGGNVSGDSSCGFAAPADKPGTNPALALLADNGGATETHALMAGSSAIDAGTEGCPPPAVDQRNLLRALDGDGNGTVRCDSGAFEAGASTPAAPPSGNPGMIQFFSVGAASVSESSEGIGMYVERIGGTFGPVTAYVTPSPGTASANSDFDPRPAFVSFADGEGISGSGAVKSVFINLRDDFVDEPNETFTLGFSNVTGATIGSPSTIAVTITDDDDPVVPSPGTFSLATRGVHESGGTATVEVSRSGSSGAVAVNYSTANGTAVAGADYQSTSGTLSWPDGDSTPRTFTILIVDDAEAEGTQSFSVSLSNPTGGATISSFSGSGTIDIIDSDSPNPGALQLSASSYQASEAGGAATVIVNRIGGSLGSASGFVNVVAGTAGGDDFDGRRRFLSWAAGNADPKTITIAVKNDDLLDPGETFMVELQPPSGAVLGSPFAATVTITDDDDTPEVPSPGVAQFAYNVSGGEGRLIEVLVIRTGGKAGAVSVQYATSPGTAGAGTDYETTSGTLSWADGDTTAKRFTISIIDDTVPENSSETFTVTLSNPTGGLQTGNPLTVTIDRDSDAFPPRGTIRFASASVSVEEGSVPSVDLVVQRVDGSNIELTVQYATAPATAAAGADYQTKYGDLSWADGDASPKTISIQILDDSVAEASEDLSVWLYGSTRISDPSRATITITDSDVAIGPARGDVNGDGSINILDVFYLVNHLFLAGPNPVGPGDVNADLSMTPADIVYLLRFLFAVGPAPPP